MIVMDEMKLKRIKKLHSNIQNHVQLGLQETAFFSSFRLPDFVSTKRGFDLCMAKL